MVENRVVDAEGDQWRSHERPLPHMWRTEKCYKFYFQKSQKLELGSREYL
jgi:hypothetical protein